MAHKRNTFFCSVWNKRRLTLATTRGTRRIEIISSTKNGTLFSFLCKILDNKFSGPKKWHPIVFNMFWTTSAWRQHEAFNTLQTNSKRNFVLLPKQLQALERLWILRKMSPSVQFEKSEFRGISKDDFWFLWTFLHFCLHFRIFLNFLLRFHCLHYMFLFSGHFGSRRIHEHVC